MLKSKRTSTIENEHRVLDFELGPNPASDYLRLKINTSFTEPLSIRLADMTGKILRVQQCETRNKRIDVSSLSPGVYLLTISNNSMTLGQRKVVIN